ncbi:MAG: hypothetical protein Q9227_009218 [Pyrenula ochraceoflavens]
MAVLQQLRCQPAYLKRQRYRFLPLQEPQQIDRAQNWLNKPDGNQGWTSYFLNEGYDIYLLDVPFRGRSPTNPSSVSTNSSYTLSLTSNNATSQVFTAPQSFDLWPQASLHTQWPGTGQLGDPVFDAFQATQVPSLTNNTLQEILTRNACICLLDRIASPAIILSHSQAGPIPWLLADARPDLVKAILSLEPSGPPLFNILVQGVLAPGPARKYGVTDIPITYDPPLPSAEDLSTTVIPPDAAGQIANCTIQAEPARKLVNLQNVPVLVVTSEAR